MELKLYNTLTREKEIFKPIKEGEVKMYTCGPTIYNYVHIGNLRAYIFSDFLRRVLKFNKFKVKGVMNLTDVDDKTIRDSQKYKLSLKEFTSKYEVGFLKDIESINIETPEIICKATDHINEMVDIIKILLKKNIAYRAEDGIYFSINKFEEYGKLSKIDLESLRQNASKRVINDEYDKESANDFALWKFWDESDGDVFWETDIGKGRPGWHIECSAMSSKYLGKQFDIHVGGEDLVFPHHENEIAQSESAFGVNPWVKFWMHNGWLLVDNKKMSKSLGNFYYMEDIVKNGYSPLDLRYFYLTKNYRQSFNFTWKNLGASQTALRRLKIFLSNLVNDKILNEKYLKEFEESINDDLNMPQALQVLWKLVKDEKATGKYQTIKKMDEVFGLDLFKVEEMEISEELKDLIEKRDIARKNKEWEKSDELREKISGLGYEVADTPEGTKVKKK